MNGGNIMNYKQLFDMFFENLVALLTLVAKFVREA